MLSKKKLTFIMIATVLSVFSGCTTEQGNSESITVKQDFEDIPKHISQKLDTNLLVNANTHVSKADNYNILNIKLKEYDEVKITDTFIKEDKIISRVENEFSKEYNDKEIIIQAENKKDIYISRDFFNYTTEQYSSYTSLIKGSNDYFIDNMKSYFPNNELQFLSKEESVEKVRQAADRMEISTSEEPIVYSLDKNSLQNAQDNFMTEEEYAEWGALKPGSYKKAWSDEDEAYLIIFNSKENNIPIYSKDSYMTGGGSFFKGTQLHALVNKDGIIMFEAYAVYDIVSINLENSLCISLEDALESVKDKYKNIIITEPIEITDIRLEYVPKTIDNKLEELILTPAWIFAIEYEEKNSDIKGETSQFIKRFIKIDAITGKEIL